MQCSAYMKLCSNQMQNPSILTSNTFKFRVCKSVPHHTFNWINQQDAATPQVYYLSFKYSSTCFGHPHAHHQELQQLQQQPLVYRRSSESKPEAATAVVAPDDGHKDARNMLSCIYTTSNKLEKLLHPNLYLCCSVVICVVLCIVCV